MMLSVNDTMFCEDCTHDFECCTGDCGFAKTCDREAEPLERAEEPILHEGWAGEPTPPGGFEVG